MTNCYRLTLLSLPKEWQDFDTKKDEAHRIDDPKLLSSMLLPLPLLLPTSESSSPSGSSELRENDEARCTSFDTIVEASKEGLATGDLIVSLDVDVDARAGAGAESTAEEPQTIAPIHLNRDATETASKAFQRLGITVVKKLSSGSKQKQKKKKKKKPPKQRNQRGNDGPSWQLWLSSTKDEAASHPVSGGYNNDGDNNNNDKTTIVVGDGSGSSEIDTDEYNAFGLCHELASVLESSGVAHLDLSIPREPAGESNDDNNDDNQTTPPVPPPATSFRFEVNSNPPVVLSAETFESFRSKLFVGLPVVLRATLLHATRAEVSWFVGSGENIDDDEEELILHDSHSFVPEPRHIGKRLTVVVRPRREGNTNNDNNEGCAVFGRPEAYRFHNAIEELPRMPIVSPLRDAFCENHGHSENKKSDHPRPLRVCTYNILADLYVSRKGTTDGETTYPHVRYEHVDKKRRIPMVVAELKAYGADVVCLQEVDGSVYDGYLEPVFGALGYDGYYSNKASSQREGCAVFWSRKTFEADERLSFDVKDLFEPSEDGIFEKEWSSMRDVRGLLENHGELKRITTEKLGQVLQIATLKPKHQREGQPSTVVVANTHLFWHPMADHIRALQVYAVSKKIDEVRRKRSRAIENNRRPSSPHPFLLCGDLNSDPLSGACRLLSSRSLAADQHDCWKYLHKYKWDVDNGDVDEMVEHGTTGEQRRTGDGNDSATTMAAPTADSLAGPLGIELPDTFPVLRSGCKEDPPFTNFSLRFVDTLDYVIASQASEQDEFGFKPIASAPMPSVADVEEFVSMPNEFMPSDHVSIVCDFDWSRWCDANSKNG